MATNTTKNTSIIKTEAFLGAARATFPVGLSNLSGGGQLKREGEVELTSVFSPIQLGKTAAMATRPAERSDP